MMKTLLEDKSGKQVAFAPMQVSYMLAHGWKRVVKPDAEPKSKSKPKPAEAEKS